MKYNERYQLLTKYAHKIYCSIILYKLQIDSHVKTLLHVFVNSLILIKKMYDLNMLNKSMS